MSDPWLTIIGIGEDGLAGLSEASRKALAEAETVFGGERHLALAEVGSRGRPWPVPFDAKIVLSCRGRPTAVLASGDPFWHGAGASLAETLGGDEWIAHPAPSTFSLAAARLGWRLESVTCLGLHAAPFERLMPHLAQGARIICLVRDAAAVGDLAKWLTQRGWGRLTPVDSRCAWRPARKHRPASRRSLCRGYCRQSGCGGGGGAGRPGYFPQFGIIGRSLRP
ncbi:precorrin-6y C5,15-methyltransferase (decarboxylating) CbiE subunit [Bradyrhizobium sp. USDA 327]